VAQYVPEEEISTFIKRADGKMYAAKNAGKNRICCAQ
jgi:PleD family two-component response regulator